MIKNVSADRFLSFALESIICIINTENGQFVVCPWSFSK